MPPLKRKILFFFVSIFVAYLLTPQTITAAPLNWHNTYPHSGRTGFVKFSSATDSTVYISFDHDGIYQILKSSDNGQTWLSIKGDLPESGDINWISDFPGNKDIIAISLWGSGIYMTENGGVTWNRIYAADGPRTVEIDPTNYNILYAGFFDGLGFNKSTNKGVSWTKQTSLGSSNVSQMTIDPGNHLRIFVVMDPKLYRSDDGGNSWSLLPLQYAFGDRLIIDRDTPSTIYSDKYGSDEGVYKSIDNGNNWTWIQNGPSGRMFQLAQDTNGDLYASRYFSSPNGGVWKGTNDGETWENVQDPAWGENDTWGIDAKGGHVVVGVGGLGIFVADTSEVMPSPTPSPSPSPSPTIVPSPTPTTGPNPIVVIPGFGGSYSTKGLILHQQTNYKDWQMMPFQAPAIYNPFLNALQKFNYLRTDKIFFFAYDFTKTIAVSGAWLNEFLDNEVLSKNPGAKVDIVSHSMGGLVARYCFEKIDGCKAKINKIVTAGTPHKGAVADYAFWEGGDVVSLDPLSRFGAELYLALNGGGNKVQTIQLTMPGAKDFMPIHDYIIGKPYALLSAIGKNPTLEALALSTEFGSKAFALSGNKPKATDAELTVKPAKPRDVLNGIWTDGVPKVSKKDIGDGTVLASSSQIAGALNKNYNLKHIDYLGDKKAVADIMQFLGLSPIGPLLVSEPNNVAIYYSTDPNVSVNVTKEAGEEIAKPDQNVVFVKGGKAKKRNLMLKANKDVDSEIKGFYYDETGATKDLKPFKTKLLKNILKNVPSQFN